MPAEAAVAQVAARRAPPRVVVISLVDVFAVAHEQAVTAKLPAERAAGTARRVLAHRLLAALVTRLALRAFVVDAVAALVVAVHE